MQIIDGYTGYGHVMSTQVAMYNEGAFGPGDCVLPVGTKFQATKMSNNQVRIGDGCGQINGIRYVIESGQVENVVIENGVTGAYRKDIIVCRYVKDDTTNVESTTLAVIKGTPGTSSSAADPSYQTGSIIGGAFVREMPLWRAVIEGTTLVGLEKMYTEASTATTNKNLMQSTDYAITDSDLKAMFGSAATMKSVLTDIPIRKTLYTSSTGLSVGSSTTIDLTGYEQIEVTFLQGTNLYPVMFLVSGSMRGGYVMATSYLYVFGVELSYTGTTFKFESASARQFTSTEVRNYTTYPTITKIVGIK